MKLLEVENLRLGFLQNGRLVLALDDVSFFVKKAETVCIVGESGCGKTLTSLSIIRLTPPSAKILGGKVIFEGRNLLKIPEKEMREIRGKEISIIFQEPFTSLNPVFTIGDQLKEAIYIHEKISEEELEKRCIDLLKLVGIPSAELRMKNYPHQLSGGQRQRVMIAMAICCRPKLLIADEPTTALDVTVQAQIIELFRRLKQEYDLSLLYVTHDLSVVAHIADRVYVMYSGMIVEEGDVFQIFYNPKHPYTRGLLESIPYKVKRKERLKSIPGFTPDLLNRPSGCPFHPRCRSSSDICFKEKPEMRYVENGHGVRCHLLEG